MKILIISDSHGNLQNIKHALGFAKGVGISKVIHCGDWDDLPAVETVLASGLTIFTVLGNADIDPKVKECLKEKSAGFDEYFLSHVIDGRKIGIIHDYTKRDKNIVDNNDIIFCGHRHSQDLKEINGVTIVRPGALKSEMLFAVYDTKTGKVEFINDQS